jgi:hypothetical protein
VPTASGHRADGSEYPERGAAINVLARQTGTKLVVADLVWLKTCRRTWAVIRRSVMGPKYRPRISDEPRPGDHALETGCRSASHRWAQDGHHGDRRDGIGNTTLAAIAAASAG